VSSTRLDRLITLAVARPLRRLAHAAPGIPVLMYHSISNDDLPQPHPYFNTGTSPRAFADQMRYLRDEHYNVLTLGELHRLLDGHHAVPERSVVLTFDDGYRDFLTEAWPVLREHGFPATVFLSTDFVGSSHMGRACLSWDEIRQAKSEGVVFGSHTASHPHLVALHEGEIAREWISSKARIEQELGEKIDLFAYPFTFPEANAGFVRRLYRILQDAGYVQGVTTIVGTALASEGNYFLPRLPINTFDDVRFFRAKLDGDYDWVHGPQLLYKLTKRATGFSGHRPAPSQTRNAPAVPEAGPVKARDKYVLITPAKNEEASIGETIASVVNQTHLPAEWVIVSDGSTDRTDEIVKAASAAHPWIRLLALPPRAQRSFAAVVHATEAGIRALTVSDYACIGLLDSDVRFQRDYFERVIERFVASPQLGLAGGVVIDIGTPKSHVPRNRQDVPGAVQFFRRSCFESLGGLVAIPEGGWDALTCARARMRGYETRLLTDLVVDHLKPRNISEGGLLRRHWQLGVRDYAAGFHPVFEVVKCVSRLADPPWLIGSIAWWIGYCGAALQRRERLLPEDLLAFIRREQKQRLMNLVLPSSRATEGGRS